MRTKHTINNTPVQITQPGQSGFAWLDDNDDPQSTEIFIYSSGGSVETGRRVVEGAAVILSPDGYRDVFYAIKNGTGHEGKLVVDLIKNIAVDVAIQDQVSPVVDFFLTRKLGTATLAAPTAFDDRTITLETEHGFTNGSMIEIDNGDMRFYQSRVRLVSGNVLTVTNPLPYAFPVESTVKRVSPDMNIDASAAPVVFSAITPVGVRWDINILAVNMLGSGATSMDDSLFGNIPALTNGVVFRTLDGETQNIFTALDNGCFLRHCDTENPYSPKAPSGSYGFNTKRHFNGQNGDGVARRIGGEDIAEFQAVIADNLAGLSRFWCVIRGHVVED